MNEEEAAKLYAYVQEEVESLAAQLKRGSLHGSTRTGLETLELMTLAVKKGKFLDIRDGLKTLRAIGRRLVQARPIELTVGNVVRRTLFIVRQENASLLRENQIGESSPVVPDDRGWVWDDWKRIGWIGWIGE